MKSLPSKFTNQNICVTHFISAALCACHLVLNYCWILDMLDVKIIFIIVFFLMFFILLNLFGGVMS